MAEYLSVRQVARRLGLKEEGVRKRLRSGELWGRKVGGIWYVDPQALAQWKARHPSKPKGRGGRPRRSPTSP